LIDPKAILGDKNSSTLKPFYMDKYEVTQEKYEIFLNKTAFKGLKGQRKVTQKALQKAMPAVSWFDANRYCRWVKKRLPTEEEWLLAARGKKRTFPWGEEQPTGKHANFCDVNCTSAWTAFEINDGYQKIAVVGNYPKGNTPEGIADMGGNLWEWTSTIFDTGKTLNIIDQTYTQEQANLRMVIKGGSYGVRTHQIATDTKASSRITYRSSHVGIRCVKTLDPKE